MANNDQQPVPSRERWRQLFEPAGACAWGGVPMFIGSRKRDPAAGDCPTRAAVLIFSLKWVAGAVPRGHAQKKEPGLLAFATRAISRLSRMSVLLSQCAAGNSPPLSRL